MSFRVGRSQESAWDQFGPSSSLRPLMRCAAMQLPEGAGRLAVFIDGTESADDIATLKVRRSGANAHDKSNLLLAAVFNQSQLRVAKRSCSRIVV